MFVDLTINQICVTCVYLQGQSNVRGGKGNNACLKMLPVAKPVDKIAEICFPRASCDYSEHMSPTFRKERAMGMFVTFTILAMAQRRRLTNVDRWRAMAWLQDDVGLREVARRLGVAHSVIQTVRDRYNATGSVAEQRRSGRPRCTTRRQDRFVVALALRQRTITASAIRTQLRAATNVIVSDQTIRNRLRDADLHARRPVIRPVLAPAHRAARLAWARRHVTWTRHQWSRVLFTDESRFTRSFTDGRNRVWRRPRERYHDANVLEHDRYGGGSVMVWGGISVTSRTPLYRVHGTLNGLAYRNDILQPLALTALQALGPDSILQDDNARPHRAGVVNDFLQQQHVTRLDWPAYSPDLSPIEHVWDVLGRRLRENHPPAADLNQLFLFLEQEWQAIPQMTLRTLVLSMRQRCNECIQAHGGHTRF